MSTTIATALLALRLLDARDESLYAALYGDPETMRLVAGPRDPTRLARAFAAECRANSEEPPRRRVWVIEDHSDGDAVGLIGLVWDAGTESGRQGAELGVVLPPARQGRGIASAAIAALCGPAFAQFGIDFLHTRHADGHGLAAGLMRRVGFVAQPARAGEAGRRWRLDRDGADHG